MQFPLHSEYVNVNGTKIHYLKSGKGKPFVIFHALFSDAETFVGLIECLSYKYTVYVPDFPGFGKSENLKGGSSLIEDNAAICDWIELLDLKDFILAGFSLGGLNILHGMERFDRRVRKYILIEPYYNVHALKMTPEFLSGIRNGVRLARKLIPPALGQKFWDSDRALKIFFATVDPLKKEKRPVNDKLRNLRTANYSTFMYYLDLVLSLEKPNVEYKTNKDALLIMSRYDSTLNFPVTYEGYSPYFNKIREIRVNLIDHYPTESLTADYFRTHFPTLLKEMLKLSDRYKKI